MFENMFKPVDLLQRGLSAAWTRNAVIRNNIANVETPGFKASDVEFESLLAQSLYGGTGFKGAKTNTNHIDIGPYDRFKGAMTHKGHIKIGNHGEFFDITPQVIRREGLSMRMDGNNVDVESENVKLAQNSLYYNTLLEKMNSELRRLKLAITEGR